MSKKRSMTVINPNTAGIDIGSRRHYVAIPKGRDVESVRSFGAFTSDLHSLADWLKKCKIESVVMESTGIYWLPLFQILENRGIKVLLVNARYAKNVPGRKSDVSDCQWLQQLHSYGLLEGSFQPDEQIRKLRAYARQRDTLVRYISSHIQHIQKALTHMNILLHNVLSDITGVSGMKIIQAIVQGERDPKILASYTDRRVKSSQEVIIKSLQGNYEEEHLFALKQSLELYDFYNIKLKECDVEIERHLQKFSPSKKQEKPSSIGKKKNVNRLVRIHLSLILVVICLHYAR